MKQSTAYVLHCGCRAFHNGHFSPCDKHAYDPKVARADALRWAVKAFCVAFMLTVLMLKCSGCSVDMAGLEGGSYDANNDGMGAFRGTGMGGNTQGDGSQADMVPDAASMDANVGGNGGGGLPAQAGQGGQGGGSVPPGPACPKRDPSNGCEVAQLVYPEGVAMCCIPTDWEAYKNRCPPVKAGCHWGEYGGNGFYGICCL